MNITSFYGSSSANNGKGALNTPETLPHFLPLLSFMDPLLLMAELVEGAPGDCETGGLWGGKTVGPICGLWDCGTLGLICGLWDRGTDLWAV
eukprot:1181426-Prorocentrum_minimum.AAC.6